jgi:hypothetical protein
MFKFIKHYTYFFSFLPVKSGTCDENEYKLINDLLLEYNKYARPTLNHTQTTDVWFGLSLSQLIDVVSKKNSFIFRFGFRRQL